MRAFSPRYGENNEGHARGVEVTGEIKKALSYDQRNPLWQCKTLPFSLVSSCQQEICSLSEQGFQIGDCTRRRRFVRLTLCSSGEGVSHALAAKVKRFK